MCEPPLFKQSRIDGANKSEHPAERIIKQIGTGHKIRYVVRSYEYQPRDGTVKPPHHIGQQLTAAYFHRRHIQPWWLEPIDMGTKSDRTKKETYRLADQ